MEEIIDDFPNTTATTGVLTDGTPVTGVFERENDQDWFKIELDANVRYVVDLEGAETGKGTVVDPKLQGLYDASGNRLGQGYDDDGGQGWNSRAVLNVQTAGTYYINAAMSYSSADDQTYTISLSRITDDFGKSPAGAGQLDIGTPVQGNIDFDYATVRATDRDWFEVSLEANVFYQFGVSTPDTLTDPTEVVPGIKMRAADGTSLEPTTSRYDYQQHAIFQEDTVAYIEVAQFRNFSDPLLGEYQLDGQEVYRSTDAEIAALDGQPPVNIVSVNAPSYSDRAASNLHDAVFGSEGDDFLRGFNGADTILGGAGDDVIIGDDRLRNDHDLEVSAMVYRAYALVLDRVPDAGGFDTFSQIQTWNNVYKVANSMVNSKEFSQRFGDMTNEEYVDFLYSNLRGVEGPVDDPARQQMIDFLDASGQTYYYWDDRRAEIAMRFIESEEATNRFSEPALDYIMRNNPSDSSDEVFSMYDALFDRLPDVGGFRNWVVDMGNGRDLAELAEKFLGSAEFAQYGNLSDRAFAERVLGNLSDTAPTEAEVDIAAGLLAGGVARADFTAAMVMLADDSGLEDWMRSLKADDVLIGGAGDDILYGGLMSDKFVFSPDAAGTDRVKDLDAWDTVDLTAFDFADVVDALTAFRQEGDQVVFEQGDVTVRFAQTDLSIFDADMLLV
ncbi:hypothetical protein [Phaeobacter sp. J2-8]|uniref:DUF4214 domain-containing protein n=1 Tax=Phaeobacter sp. J2-8 TaxID=2931394 RepID=UPI001FD19E0E|nr:hypothetical protein [Phaeobacter sp. J2-8]MCJ7872256.1 hypothetical protein [Phaeobacter sp. J2-8]